MEVWKDVVGAESRYQVSNLGRVYSKTREVRTRGNGVWIKEGFVMKPTWRESDTRWMINITWNDGKDSTVPVSNLILTAFVGPRPKKHNARHKNLDRRDLRLENLEWAPEGTRQKDRILRGTNCPGTKHWRCKNRSEDDIREIRRLHREGETQVSLAKKFSLTVDTVFNIVHRVTWKYTE